MTMSLAIYIVGGAPFVTPHCITPSSVHTTALSRTVPPIWLQAGSSKPEVPAVNTFSTCKNASRMVTPVVEYKLFAAHTGPVSDGLLACVLRRSAQDSAVPPSVLVQTLTLSEFATGS